MQMAVIEFARNVLGLKDAHSTEMNPNTPMPVIDLMEEQKKVTIKGGTMRLGSYPCVLKEGSLARHIYGREDISERHRPRSGVKNAPPNHFRREGLVPPLPHPPHSPRRNLQLHP